MENKRRGAESLRPPVIMNWIRGGIDPTQDRLMGSPPHTTPGSGRLLGLIVYTAHCFSHSVAKDATGPAFSATSIFSEYYVEYRSFVSESRTYSS